VTRQRAAYIRRAAARIAEQHRRRTVDAAALDRVILDQLREVHEEEFEACGEAIDGTDNAAEWA
jgi:hypothetical protein